MASFYGPSLAFSALSNAIGSGFQGAAQGQEDLLKRQHMQAQQDFMKAQTAKMQQPQTWGQGRNLFERGEDGSWKQVAQGQPTEQDRYMGILADKGIAAEQRNKVFRENLPAILNSDDFKALPPFMRRAIEAAAPGMDADDFLKTMQVWGKEYLEGSSAKGQKYTSLVQNALAEAGLDPLQQYPPQIIQNALTKYQNAQQKRLFDRQANYGQFTFGLQQMGAEITRLAKAQEGINDVTGLLSDMKQASKQVNTFGTEGRITGYAERKIAELLQTPGMGEHIAQLNTLGARLAQLRGALNEVGVLSNQDIFNMAKLQIQPHDTWGVANVKINEMAKLVNNAINLHNYRAKESYSRLKTISQGVGAPLHVTPVNPLQPVKGGMEDLGDEQ